MTAGRPLRFLVAVLGGWTALRIAMLMPEPAANAAPAPDRTPISTAPLVANSGREPIPAGRASPVFSGVTRAGPAEDRRAGPARRAEPTPVLASAAALPRSQETSAAAPDQSHVAPTLLPPLVAGPPLVVPTTRLAVSAWLIARGGASGTLTGGQLGGSQAGVRISYALGEARRLAVAARVATPLSGRGREAALGIEWRPVPVPVRIVAEQRFALDGGRGGPTLLAVGGVGPVAMAPGVRIEAYGEGGGIVRGGVAEAFGDGAARVTHPLGRLGGLAFDLGAGAWGAAQRGARRLDVGPTLGAAVPIGRRALRATLDWRARIAGDARPGSGPALSIGTDF